jgi:hypothetical protein
MKKRTDVNKATPERDQAMEEQIYDALIDKGWIIPQTEEEVLRAEQALAQVECSPLPPEMADPYRLFDRLEDDPGEEQLLRALSAGESRQTAAPVGEAGQEAAGATDEHASVLADLRVRTRLPASQIAVRMGVTVPFLSAVGRYPKVVPIGWRRELDARAERGLGTQSGVVMSSFERPYQAQMAASRDEAYDAERMTPERILDQSGMGEEERREWFRLASAE